MGNRKLKNDELVVDTPADMEAFNEDLLQEDEGRSYEIVEATIKDGFCHYRYQVTKGLGVGDFHNVKGSGIIKPTMEKAFGKLRVHMAVIDGVFRHSNIEIDDVDKFHIHELTDLFHVNGIKMRGSEDNETVELIGSKHVTWGRIAIGTPKIALDSLSSYTWHNELDALVKLIREEVSLYKEGNYTLPDEDEEEEAHKAKGKKIKQRTIGDELKEREAESQEGDTNDDHQEEDLKGDVAISKPNVDMDFEKNKV